MEVKNTINKECPYCSHSPLLGYIVNDRKLAACAVCDKRSRVKTENGLVVRVSAVGPSSEGYVRRTVTITPEQDEYLQEIDNASELIRFLLDDWLGSVESLIVEKEQ